MMVTSAPYKPQTHGRLFQRPGWSGSTVPARSNRFFPSGQQPAAVCRSSSTKQQQQSLYELLEERGVEFMPGRAFYRAESAQGRDLAVLAAAVYRRQHGQLRVLDVMAGSGMRGARYIQQAGADMVWCNDYDRRNNTALVYNLVNALQHSSTTDSSSSKGSIGGCSGSSSGGSTGSSDGGVEARVQQWMAEAEPVKYEGIRGNVLQWQQQQEQQQPSPKQQEQHEQQQQLQEQHKQQQQQEHQQQLDCQVQAVQQKGSPMEQPQLPSQQQSSDAQLEQLPLSCAPPLLLHQQQQQQQQQQRTVRVTHVEARRLLASVYLQEDYYDLVDVDSFGSDTSHLAGAIDALKYGGMLYLTSTDGMSAAGKRPSRALAAYGCYPRCLPSANEQGLRMLIGAAVREGAARGVTLTPLFSLYSYHGPVFRVMLRATRSSAALQHYSYVGHCFVHGENYRVGWRGLSQAWCRCLQQPAAAAAAAAAGEGESGSGVPLSQARPTPLVLTGPMWTGPLHDTEFVASMSELAAEWGWQGSAVPADSPYVVRQSKNNRQRPLEDLLQLLAAESAPELPPWFIAIDTLAQHLNTTPSRDKLVSALQARGFAACCCHVEHRALRTNATTAQVLQVAVEDCGYSLRPGGQPGVPQALLQQHQLEASLDVQESSNGISGSDSRNDGSSHEDNSGGSSSSSLVY